MQDDSCCACQACILQQRQCLEKLLSYDCGSQNPSFKQSVARWSDYLWELCSKKGKGKRKKERESKSSNFWHYLSNFRRDLLPLVMMMIILKLQSWKGPYGSSSPAPVKEAQWGIEPPASGSTIRDLNH